MSDTYTYYLIDKTTGEIKGGYEYKDDAKDAAQDVPNTKVVHKRSISPALRENYHRQNRIMSKLGGHGRRGSSTYGVLPPYDEFLAAFEDEVESGTYAISNDKGGRDGDYSAPQLWKLIETEMERFELGDEEAGDFVSAVLDTLGFEWI